jgi:DNA excision repair protein ERCC-4
MDAVCRIIADFSERPSGVPDLLVRLGAEVEVRRLVVGDYELETGVVVERKAMPDLHSSLRRGRLWPQLGRLRADSRTSCLLVEGVQLRGPIREDAIRAVLLAASDLGCLVVRSTSRRDSAAWLLALARRAAAPPRARIRPAYAQRAQPRERDAAQAMLAAIPGVSAGTARALLDTFGSVAGVLRATDDELLAVRGVGSRRLRALRATAF